MARKKKTENRANYINCSSKLQKKFCVYRLPRKKIVEWSSSMTMNLLSLYPQPFHFSNFSRSRGITLTTSWAAPHCVFLFAAFSRRSYAISAAVFDLLLLMANVASNSNRIGYSVTRSLVHSVLQLYDFNWIFGFLFCWRLSAFVFIRFFVQTKNDELFVCTSSDNVFCVNCSSMNSTCRMSIYLAQNDDTVPLNQTKVGDTTASRKRRKKRKKKTTQFALVGI